MLDFVITAISYLSTCPFVWGSSATHQEAAIGLIEIASGRIQEAVKTVGQTERHTLAIAAVMPRGVGLWLFARALVGWTSRTIAVRGGGERIILKPVQRGFANRARKTTGADPWSKLSIQPFRQPPWSLKLRSGSRGRTHPFTAGDEIELAYARGAEASGPEPNGARPGAKRRGGVTGLDAAGKGGAFVQVSSTSGR